MYVIGYIYITLIAYTKEAKIGLRALKKEDKQRQTYAIGVNR